MTDKLDRLVFQVLDTFNIEVPSWGFANTGTRFGKFIQPAAAVSIEDTFSDASQVHASTGTCPTIALHVQWDLPGGLRDVPTVQAIAAQYGIRPGSINPNVFQDQEYKYGSIGNPDPAIRKRALDHILECVAIADALHAACIAGVATEPRTSRGPVAALRDSGYSERITAEGAARNVGKVTSYA